MLFFASSVLGAKMIQNEGKLLVDFKDTEFIQDIRINEEIIKDAYILQDGVVYVPLKKVVLTLKEDYQYSKKENWVVITTSKEKFKMLLNSSQYFVGKEVHNYKIDPNQNEVKPIFIKGRIYAPLQFVEEICSVKLVGKTLYIESKTNSLEVETEIEKEIIAPVDETEQRLENTINENKINDVDEDKDKIEESSPSKRTKSASNSSSKSKSENTTKKKKKKKKNSSNQSNTTPQEQQNSIDTDPTENDNQSENNSENTNENTTENNSENVNESQNNSESNENNEAAEQEPTESTPVDQENTPSSEIDSELN